MPGWLETLHGRSPGYVVVSAIKDGEVRSAAFGTDELDRAQATIDVTAPKGDVYVSCGTFGTRPERGKRGTAADVVAVPGVWADLDCGTEGHAERANGLPNPATVDAALSVIVDAGLPEPSVVVLSGHGAQAWWLLEEPYSAEPEDIARLTVGWSTNLVRVFAETGYGLDNLGDPARILRPPGTFNHKRGDRKPVTVHPLWGGLIQDGWDDLTRYALDKLQAYCEDVDASQLVRVSQGQTTPAITPVDLLDAFTQLTPWDAILGPHGWSLVRTRGEQEYWLRPEKGEGHSAICGPYAMTCFSETAGFPTGAGHKLTKLRVFAALNHNGDERAAVRAITERLSS